MKPGLPRRSEGSEGKRGSTVVEIIGEDRRAARTSELAEVTKLKVQQRGRAAILVTGLRRLP